MYNILQMDDTLPISSDSVPTAPPRTTSIRQSEPAHIKSVLKRDTLRAQDEYKQENDAIENSDSVDSRHRWIEIINLPEAMKLFFIGDAGLVTSPFNRQSLLLLKNCKM